uniref:NRF domain-containing protein n=1 Tax=Syphacia muris TaxID=451379 RepID=A0A0N5A8L2_9BILA
MSINSITVFVLFLAVVNYSYCCSLCLLRLPPRPRPIDHFLLPSFESSVFPDSITKICNGTTRLEVSYSCGQQILRIICSISDFITAQTTSCSITDPYEQCKNCFQRKAAIIEKNFWAITWLDSLGKMPSAISEGNYFWFGDYEQCVKLKESGNFNGRYCQAHVEIPDATVFPKCLQEDPLEIRLGFCAPDECSTKELNLFFQS